MQTRQCLDPECRLAGEEQPLENFYPSKNGKFGRRPRCIECCKRRQNTDEHRALVRKSTLEYIHTDEGKAVRKAYSLSEQGKEAQRKANQNYSGSEKSKANDARKRERNKLQYLARNEVNKAKQSGRLPCLRDAQCAKCGNQARHYHHYLGYEPKHWLDVEPLCQSCHSLIHQV